MYGLRINNILVPLPAESSIRMDRYSSLFTDDIATGEFSFPFDLPITPQLKRALKNVDFTKSIIYGTEYTCDVIDAGITRYPQAVLVFLGKSKNKLKVNITFGMSKISKWMKETRLRDLDLGSVILNADPVQKFVVFEFTEPAGSDANDGFFGIAVNGTVGALGVPWNTDMETTIADWVIYYNNGSLSPTYANLASQPAPNQIRFDTLQVGGSAPLDWTMSIGEANLPVNGFMEPWTVAVVDEFDYDAWVDDTVVEVNAINAALVAGPAEDCEICFPVIKNPKFIEEELDDPAAEFGGYLNYTAPGSSDQLRNENTDGLRWKYHLSPQVVMKWLLKKVFSLNGYQYSDDFSAEFPSDILKMYCNKGADQVFIDSNDKVIEFPPGLSQLGKTFNMYAGEILLTECVPNLTVIELITALKRWSNLLVRLNDVTHEVEMNRIDPIFDDANTDVQDLSAEEDITDDFDIENPNGITLALTPDSGDDLNDELLKNHRDFTVAAEDVLPGVALFGEIRYMNNMNQYYRYNAAGWYLYAEGLDNFILDQGEKAISTDLGTLYTFSGFDALSGNTRQWTVPYTKQTGNHQRPGFVPNEEFSLRILFWRGIQLDSDGGDYYLANNHFQINEGTLSCNFAVHYYGEKGKYETDYRRWFEFIRLARNCFKTFYLPLGKQNLLDLAKWIGANGKRYLARRISQSLPYSRKVLIECLQKAASEGELFTLQPTICADAGALLLTPLIPGGVFSGTGVVPFTGDYYFDPSVGVGIYEVTYTIQQTSFTQTIEVKPLPTVTLAPFSPVSHLDPPFALTGGLPLGGIYSGPGVTAGVFDPGIGAGTYTIMYSYTDAFTCGSAAFQDITVT